jgi:SAM-dependent methyltransferase
VTVAKPGEDHLERLDPAVNGGTVVASEHFLRYQWAAELVAGKRVLDAGCGTGYGAALMAASGAKEVIGVDVAEDAVSRARELSDAEFHVADVRNLPFTDDAFEVVTCFEVIEHVNRADEVLAELKRVLSRQGGLLLISSPNRNAYPSGNPHHVTEFLPDELGTKVRRLFPNVVLYRQDSFLASAITDAQAPPVADLGVEVALPAHFGTKLKPGAQPYFLIAASQRDLPAIRNRAAFGDLFEVRWWKDEQLRLANEIADAQTHLAELEGRLAEAAQEAERTRAEATYEIDLVRARARDAEGALFSLESQRATELELIRQAEDEVDAARAAFNEAHTTIQAMHRTRAWRLGATWWRIRAWLLRRGPQ